MKYDFIQAYCLSKKGAEEDYKQEWDAVRYTIRGKMFALVGNDNSGKPIISVKHDPEYGEELREKYKDITAGYYLNKVHWSSVFLGGDVPETVLKQLLDGSYELIFNYLHIYYCFIPLFFYHISLTCSQRPSGWHFY